MYITSKHTQAKEYTSLDVVIGGEYPSSSTSASINSGAIHLVCVTKWHTDYLDGQPQLRMIKAHRTGKERCRQLHRVGEFFDDFGQTKIRDQSIAQIIY
jgi:hypothetical protein